MLRESIEYPRLKRESTTYKNSREAILNEIVNTGADLIVMRERSRGIFDRLFHSDTVKTINEHTRIPLLTYNERSLQK